MSAPGRHMDVATSAARMPDRPPTTPWGCTRLFELRHVTGELVPAQLSGYAASLIRSDMLGSDEPMSLGHRHSCELTRLVPSTLTAGGLAPAGLCHHAVRPRLRPVPPRRACRHARASGHAASPSSGPAACGPTP